MSQLHPPEEKFLNEENEDQDGYKVNEIKKSLTEHNEKNLKTSF